MPISLDIGVLSTELPLHGDPADRLIVATALTHAAKLVTADHRLLAASLVPTIW